MPALSRSSAEPARRASAWLCAGRRPGRPSSSARATPPAPGKPQRESKPQSAAKPKLPAKKTRRLRRRRSARAHHPVRRPAALLKQIKPAIRPGSIVIDATVPLAASVGGRATRTLGVWQGSAAQQTAELVPKFPWSRAFQNISADLLNGDGPVDCDVIVCSDDPDATQDGENAGGENSRGPRH